MHRLLLPSIALSTLIACGDGTGTPPDTGSGDASADTDADGDTPEPVTFDAEPDPAEIEGCRAEPPAEGVVRAKHVDCEDEVPSGSVAMGRVGDVIIENARARFIVRTGEESATIVGAYAGGIVDAAPQGGDDLVKEIFTTLDLSAARATDVVVTDAGGDGDASVRVLFEMDAIGLISSVLGNVTTVVPARGAIDYELAADEAALRMTVSFTSNGERPVAGGGPGLIALMGGAGELVQPGGEVLTGDAAGTNAGTRLVGEAPGTAVAVRLLPGGGSVSRIDSIHIINAEGRAAASVGGTDEFEARIGVGTNAAQAWNAVHHDEEGWAALELNGADGDRVQVSRADDGAPMLRTAFDGGEASVRLPPAGYRLTGGFESWFVTDPQNVTLGDGGATATAPAPPSGILHVEATAGGESAAPVRVTVRRPDGSELHRFVAVGPSDFRVPPGDYTVTVSRGMEYDMYSQDVTVTDGDTTSVTAVIDRVVDTAGWVAGDFHLHSEMSTDSTHALADAVRIVAAEGLEVVAATDHDFLTRYDPALAGTGLDEWVLAVVGEELSHPLIAHVNGYPLERSPSRAGYGAHGWFDTTPGEWFDALRDMGDESLGGAVVALNHPRRSSSGYFDSIELDRTTGMATVAPMDIQLPAETDLNDFDFDAIEVWGKSPGGDDEETLLDWLALQSMGRDFTMLANSDSHDPGNPAGSPRSFLKVPDDSLGAYTWEQVGTAIRSGEVTVSGGIFVTAELDGPASGGSVPVHVTVQAAPWVEVDRLRVYAGTEVVIDRSIAPTMDVVRVDEVVDVPLGGASFVAVRADGRRAPAPIIDFEPFGMTNAIAVD